MVAKARRPGTHRSAGVSGRLIQKSPDDLKGFPEPDKIKDGFTQKKQRFLSYHSYIRILIVTRLVIGMHFLPGKQGKYEDDNRNYK